VSPLGWILVGLVLGVLASVSLVLLVGRRLLRRRVPPRPVSAVAGAPVRRTPVEARESAAAVLNAEDPAQRRVIPHAPRKES